MRLNKWQRIVLVAGAGLLVLFYVDVNGPNRHLSHVDKLTGLAVIIIATATMTMALSSRKPDDDKHNG